MKANIIILIALLLTINFVSNGNALTGEAGMPGTFLHMGIGARALGMGKAYTALSNDATAIYWNPAGLALQDKFQIYGMHSALFMDTQFDYVAGVAPTLDYGTFGFGVLTLSSEGFEQRSMLNEELGEFGMRDLATFISWSKELSQGISVGINYKLISQKIFDVSGIGHGVDLGFKKRMFDRLELGLMFTNLIKPKIKLVNQAEVFPMQFRFGAATRFMDDKLTISSDVAKIAGWGSTHLNFGVEYQALNYVALRSGMEEGRFTVGVGFNFRQTGIDYSSARFSELGTNHRFAVNYTFGGFGISAIAKPKIFSPMSENNIAQIELNAKTRSAVTEWVLEIIDNEGRLVRQYSNKGEIPEKVIWDGRDNNGILVKDGTFGYRFDIITIDGKNSHADGSLVTIDSQGPEGTLGLID